MGRVLGAGSFELFFAPANHFADDQAPTLAELNDAAVIYLTDHLAPAGIDTPFAGNVADAADWSSTFNKTGRGTIGGDQIEAEFWFDTPDNLAWVTLPRFTEGYFVISILGLAAPPLFTANDEIEVWPIDTLSRARVRTPRDENQRFLVQAAVPGVPLEDYTVPAV